MALDFDTFIRCSPVIRTNIKECDSVTICDAVPPEIADIVSMYGTEDSQFRVMDALFRHDFELKMCGTVQHGLYELIMSQKVNMSKRMSSRRLNTGLIEVAPFVLARQYDPINNEYWKVTAGEAGTDDWRVTIESTTGIQADLRTFPVGIRVFIRSQVEDGGAVSETAWQVAAVDTGGDGELVLDLTSQNAESDLDEDKLDVEPTQGLLRRGTANVNNFEQYCPELPAYLNMKDLPFWVETTRTASCRSTLYEKWRKLLLDSNQLYREYFDLPEIEKNRQLGMAWQRGIVNDFFFSKKLVHQNLSEYNSLDEIEVPELAEGLLGVVGDSYTGSKCIGKRANVVGIYEQLAECGRVSDCLGEKLNLPDLFTALYSIMRVRSGIGRPVTQIDAFTDSVTADLINQGMLHYYISRGQNAVRLNLDIGGETKTANFGFNYRSYKLHWPNVTLNIVTHFFFDDFLAAATDAGIEDAARVLWIIDFAGIYPGILATKQVELTTGDLKTLAAVNTEFACVMDTPKQTINMTSMTWTIVVECPAAHCIIENFANEQPEDATPGNGYCCGAEATTTTTTAARPQ